MVSQSQTRRKRAATTASRSSKKTRTLSSPYPPLQPLPPLPDVSLSGRVRKPSERARPPPSPPSNMRNSTAHTLLRLARSNTPLSSQLDLDLEEDELELAESEDIQNEDETEEDEANVFELLKFSSNWRVVTGKDYKETLPGTKSGVFDEDTIHFCMIQNWYTEVFENTKPRKFYNIRCEAIASYDKCSKRDEFPQAVSGYTDLMNIICLLKHWRESNPRRSFRLDIVVSADEDIPVPPISTPTIKRGRQTATSAQRIVLPFQEQSEVLSGNFMPEIAKQWPCTNIGYSNKGYTCFIQGSDFPQNHYPIGGEVLQAWSREIASEPHISSTMEPSANIIMRLANDKNYGSRKKKQEDPLQQLTLQSLTLLLLFQMISQNILSQQQTQPPLLQPPLQPIPEPYLEPPTSSPAHGDPDEMLEGFFNWLQTREGWTSEKQQQAIKQIKETLINDDWDIDSLRKVTDERWEGYGFKIGTLERLQRQISLFKQQQRFEK